MPKASHTVEVRAPVEVVWRLLLDKVEHPGNYVPDVSAVAIVERAPGYVVRQMSVAGIEVSERITAFEKTHEVDFVLIDHPVYAGQVVNRIDPPFRPGLACRLTFTLDWRRKDGKPDDVDLQPSIVKAVEKTRDLAEKQAG